VEACEARGVRRLVGVYRPTEKNGMVREMYGALGFARVAGEDAGETRWVLELEEYRARAVPIVVDVMREALV